MKLTPEQIKSNFDKILNIIDKFFTGERKEKLLELHNSLAERIMFAPASSIRHFHGAYPGGYVVHVLNVIRFSLKLYTLWQEMGATMDGYTKDELVFCALCHDLGKLGDLEDDMYIPNDSDWHIKNRGEIYKLNPKLDNMKHQERSLFLLQHYGIKYNLREQIGIQVHDGPFDQGNSFYWINFNEEKLFKTNLPFILHQADFMSYRIEHEIENGNRTKKQIKNKPKVTKDPKPIFENLFDDVK